MMLISAMIASNLPMTTVFAAAKKQQVKQETKKLEEQSRKMQQEIKDLDEKMIKSNDAYEACQEKLISVQKQLKKTQQELKEAKASKEDQSRIMSKRIKFLYENGNMAYMEVIFEANNFQADLANFSPPCTKELIMFQRSPNMTVTCFCNYRQRKIRSEWQQRV